MATLFDLDQLDQPLVLTPKKKSRADQYSLGLDETGTPGVDINLDAPPEVTPEYIRREMEGVTQESEDRLAEAQRLNEQAQALKEEALKIAGPNTPEALKARSQGRGLAMIARSADKLAATLSKRNIDETNYKNLMAGAEEPIQLAKEKEGRDLKRQQLLKQNYGELLRQRENDPNSPESVTFRQFFKNTEAGKRIDAKTLDTMSKKDMLSSISAAQADAQLKIAGLTAKRQEDAVSQGEGDKSVYLSILDTPSARKRLNIPEGQDLTKSSPEAMKALVDRLAAQERAAQAALRAANKKAIADAKSETEKIQKEVVAVGKELAPINDAERLTKGLEELVANGALPNDSVAKQLATEALASPQVQGSLLLGTLARSFTDPKDQQAKSMIAAINEAIAKSSGGVVTISDREGAQIMSGLRASASPEARQASLDLLHAKMREAEENVAAMYPRGYEEYKNRRQNLKEGKSNVPAKKPAENSTQQKKSALGPDEVRYKIINGGKEQTVKLKKSDVKQLLQDFPGAVEVK